MDLFVPAKPPLGVQDKAAGPQNPQWLQGTANAVMRAQRGFPSGLAPNPCAAGVALLGKAASLACAVRLVSTRIRSQRGDERVHDTLYRHEVLLTTTQVVGNKTSLNVEPQEALPPDGAPLEAVFRSPGARQQSCLP